MTISLIAAATVILLILVFDLEHHANHLTTPYGAFFTGFR